MKDRVKFGFVGYSTYYWECSISSRRQIFVSFFNLIISTTRKKVGSFLALSSVIFVVASCKVHDSRHTVGLV